MATETQHTVKPQLAGSRTLKTHMALDDRPREKAKLNGFKTLSLAEIFAIIMGSGTPGESVVDLCQRILNDNNGKLYEIARLDYRDLMKRYRGIGEVKALELKAALEIATRYQLEDFQEKYVIKTSEDAYKYLRFRMKDSVKEHLWVVFLDRSKHVLSSKCLSEGGTSSTVGDVKLILKAAIDNLADTIILAHNHPSNNANPSPQDDALTRKVAAGGRAVGIPMVDHIIVCQNDYYSYCDHNRL